MNALQFGFTTSIFSNVGHSVEHYNTEEAEYRQNRKTPLKNCKNHKTSKKLSKFTRISSKFYTYAGLQSSI